MHDKYLCSFCLIRFKTAQLKKLHLEFAHNNLPEDPSIFLEEPEPVTSNKDLSYNQILENKAKRFPAYKRYTGRGKDYYNESHMMEALGIVKGKK